MLYIILVFPNIFLFQHMWRQEVGSNIMYIYKRHREHLLGMMSQNPSKTELSLSLGEKHIEPKQI